jgi:hypothetical protein
VEAQQLATKVSQLESRVAALEDEGKIVKGEVKQILTEIRSAILVRENPFDGDAIGRAPSPPLSVVSLPVEPAAKVEVVAPEPVRETPPAAKYEPAPAPVEAPPKEPVMLRPAPAPVAAPEPESPQWSLLTIAGLSAWAEDAVRRIGSLRLEILLDLCEAAGHLSTEARIALARVTELDLPEPEHTPSTNETVVILRQLDALVNDGEDYGHSQQARRV